MKKNVAVVLGLSSALVAAACSDEPTTPVQPSQDGASAGGSAGSGGRAGSAGSAGIPTGGTSGAGGKGGAAGTAGNSLDGGPDDVATGDEAGDNDASVVADTPIEPTSFDDGSFPPNAMIGSCDPLNWIASASSSAANNPATNAIDGLPASRWSTGIAQGFGEYYQIDFGG